MPSASYQSYLRSDHWQALRLQKLATTGAVCHFCRERSLSNDIHHVKYPSNLKDTRLRHLRCLCRRCHDLVHSVLLEFPGILKEKRTSHRWRATEFHVRRRLGQRPSLHAGTPEELREYELSQQAAMSFAKRRLAVARKFATMAFHSVGVTKATRTTEAFAEWLHENISADHIAVLLMASIFSNSRPRLSLRRLTKRIRAVRWKRYLREKHWAEAVRPQKFRELVVSVSGLTGSTVRA